MANRPKQPKIPMIPQFQVAMPQLPRIPSPLGAVNPFFNPAFVSYTNALQGALGQMASILGRNQQAMLAIRDMLLKSPVIQEWLRQQTQLKTTRMQLPIQRQYIEKFSPVERERVRMEALRAALGQLSPYVSDVYRS